MFGRGRILWFSLYLEGVVVCVRKGSPFVFGRGIILCFTGQSFVFGTGSSLCLKIDIKGNKVYYQECYSQYANFNGKNAYGDERTDKLYHPTPGLNTMSLSQFYGAAIGWV